MNFKPNLVRPYHCARRVRVSELGQMLTEGTYIAWFKTPAGEGTGIAHLRAGEITGGDSILAYCGTYSAEGDLFKAVIRTKRHTTGHSTIFGIDELTLRVEGKCNGHLARCHGHADEIPHVLFESTLIYSRPEDPRPQPASLDYHPERLPTPPRLR